MGTLQMAMRRGLQILFGAPIGRGSQPALSKPKRKQPDDGGAGRRNLVDRAHRRLTPRCMKAAVALQTEGNVGRVSARQTLHPHPEGFPKPPIATRGIQLTTAATSTLPDRRPDLQCRGKEARLVYPAL